MDFGCHICGHTFRTDGAEALERHLLNQHNIKITDEQRDRLKSKQAFI